MRLNILICNISTSALPRLISPGSPGRISSLTYSKRAHSPIRWTLGAPGSQPHLGKERSAAILAPTHPKHTPSQAASSPGEGRMACNASTLRSV